MSKIDFPSWPAFTQEEADKAAEVLLGNKVNYWTGTEGREFESEFAQFAGTRHAIAVANGTVALDLALYALGIGARNGGSLVDEVIVTPRTFMASASCIVFAGARPVFADVDPDSQNITPESIAKVITPYTRGIIAVHLAGWPCDMEGIMELAGRHDIKVIEDCAQAHGAHIRGRSVGSFGHVNAWSFCQDKIMTTAGEGGMVTTNDEILWSKMWSFKDHGKSYDAVYHRQHPAGFRWLHESFGTNWRLTEIQSAIGRIQLRRMPAWTEARRTNGAILDEACSGIPCIRIPQVPAHIGHARYKHYMFVVPGMLVEGWSRDRIISEIAAAGVPCLQGSCSEVYLEKAFDNSGYRPVERLPVAKELGETSLMFMVHPTIPEEVMRQSAAVVRGILLQASGL